MRQRMDLTGLLVPHHADGFFSTYWERRHLLIQRQQPDFYESLITAADLEHLISCSDMRYPGIRLAKGGGYLSPEVYTRNIKHGDESFLGVPDVRKIAEEYRRGATVVLPAIHRTWPALGSLCDQLQSEFDHPAHANVYITPGTAAGFTPHYDVHEVFVLQIAGKKHWSLYAPVIDLPHRSQVCGPQTYSGQAPMAEIELSPGDLLYLPRGFLHSTMTADGFSVHVTIGITVYTWVDLLKEQLQTAVGEPRLRKALPPGFASRAELRTSLRKEMRDALERLRESTDIDRLVDSFIERIRAAQVPRADPFKVDVTAVTLDSLLKAAADETYRFVEEDSKTLLEFRGVRYQISTPVELAIRTMSGRSPFRGVELTEHLDSDSRLVLIRHLVDIEFLTAAP
jgi:ribosomal protein L16 Arg81 hydroxylase